MEYAYQNTQNQVSYLQDVVSRIYKKGVDVRVELDKSVIDEKESRIKELEKDKKVSRLADKIKGKIVSIEKI